MSEPTMKWRPIETAPKGRFVLLYHPPTSGRNAQREWISAGFYPPTYPRKPTHWCPVPPPPRSPDE